MPGRPDIGQAFRVRLELGDRTTPPRLLRTLALAYSGLRDLPLNGADIQTIRLAPYLIPRHILSTPHEIPLSIRSESDPVRIVEGVLRFHQCYMQHQQMMHYTETQHERATPPLS